MVTTTTLSITSLFSALVLLLAILAKRGGEGGLARTDMVSLLPEEMAVWNFFGRISKQAESSMIILWLTAFDMACVHTTHSFMSVFL